MAILAETRVRRASPEQADALDASVEAAMMEAGGPPAGLMVHFHAPQGEGFRLCNIWRTEAEMDAFYRDVIRPKLAAAGLEADDTEVSPVWGFARP